MKIYNLAVIGAGVRGSKLARFALETKRAKIVAVVDTNDIRINLFQKEFSLPKNNCYQDYRTLLKDNLKIDGVFITTTPNFHAETACAFLEKGIPVFLEKPMATNLKDAARIVKVAKETGTRLQVGFNCRYAPFFVKIKELISSGKLGKLISLEWKEVLSPYHWSTYNWHPSYNKREIIGSWLLEKCCHDLDLMNWFVESPCVRVSSFGGRIGFSLPPMEIPSTVLEHFPELKKFVRGGKIEWQDYSQWSDLVDHQTSILEYENGVTASFSLLPLIQKEHSTRFVYICGSKATLIGDWTKNSIRLFPHESKEEIVYDPDLSAQGGHGGGDPRIVSAFLDWLDDPNKLPKTKGEEGYEAMLVGCGIDSALREHRVIKLKR